MAQLSRLSLQGIRSYGPEKDDVQYVKFISPVTLILGQNGCGKTTIIEALKFATTGEFPAGSSSGQGFVNDPKLSNRDISYGQIKLEIKDAKGEKYLIIKSMQVTQKKDKMQFKSLDNTITRGDGQGVSSRCIDATENACTVMGVSKPILNNVIFCHQEDSLWPLEESKKLKEKFDAIFDAVKYNKTCDQFRKLIKEREANMKVLKEILNGLKDKQFIVKTKQKLLRETEAKKEKCDKDIDGIVNEISPITKRLQEIIKKEGNIAELEKSLVAQKCELKSLNEQINTFLKNFDEEEFAGSDKELQKEIEMIKNQQNSSEQKIEDLEKKIAVAEKQQQLIDEKMSAKQVSIGRLQADKQQNCADLETRKTKIQEAAASLKIPKYSMLDTEESINAAIDGLKTKMESMKEEVQQKKADFDKEDADLQNQLDKCRDKCVSTKSSITSINTSIQEFQRNNSQVQSQLRELNFANSEIDQIKRKISQLDNSLDEIKSSYDNALPEKIEKSNQSIQGMEQELNILEQEYKVLQKNAITENELQNLRQTNLDCKNKLLNLNEKHEENFAFIFPKGIPKQNLKLAVEEIIYEEDKKLKRFEANKLSLEKLVTTTDTKLNYERKNTKNLEQELRASLSKIESATDNQDFNAVLSETTVQLEETEKKKASYTHMKYILDIYIKELRKSNPCCPICERDFKKEPPLVEKIVKKINLKIKDIPLNLQREQINVDNLKDKYKNLLQLQPVQEKVEKLQTEIPDSKTTIENYDSELRGLKNQLKNLVESINGPQQKLNVANTILNDAGLIEKFQSDIETNEDKILELESQLIKTSSNRSVEQVSMLIDDLKDNIKSLNREIESFKQKVDRYKNQCQEMRDKRNTQMEKRLKLEKNLQNVVQLESKLEENRTKEETLRTKIKVLEEQLQQFQAKQNKVQQLKNETKVKNDRALQDIQESYSQNEKLFDDIQSVHVKVRSYRTSRKEQQLGDSLEELQGLKAQFAKFNDMKRTIFDLKADFQKKIANNDQLLRHLKDNISLREKRLEFGRTQEVIAGLEEEIGSQNKASLSMERLKLTNSYSSLTDKCNRLKGSSEELINVIKEIKNELNMPIYRDVEQRFKEQYCTNKVTERTIAELKQYLGGLEYAIMQFHKHRMVQINDRLRSLWRTIYKGNDIDYIEIMTEETVMGVGKRRTFNYKVMQLKQNVKLEMRGRCSAGQKVLACLLIRIALAETFSTNCGILALDEPTTNLDKENIRSLSQALSQIIAKRQNEKNFQLVVITHDEEFLDNLRTQTGNVPYYWHVSRNANGMSVIRKQSND